MKCYWCKRDLLKGEHAYIQEVKQTKVVGNKVSKTITEVVSCVTCAK